MAQLPDNPTLEELGRIFTQAFKASGKSYEDFKQRQYNYQADRPPVAQMFAASPIAAATRQILPEKAGDTRLGKLIADLVPERYRQKVEGVGLGGYPAEALAEFSAERAQNPELRERSVEVGKIPIGPDGVEAPAGAGNYRAKAAQAAGVVAADLASDGMRNIWWFLNAPQAIAQVAMFQGINQATRRQQLEAPDGLGQGKFMGQQTPVIRNRNLRMAAAAPAWIAASMGVGNFMRQPGYKAVLPSEDDPTQTSNPAGELASRYFLGRSGALLPYEEFRKERPDVSQQEYNAYKNYLFSGKSPLKATVEGPQGPEVTFMGKSIPLATGLLPMAAAVVGARRGVKRGMTKVASKKLNKEQKSGSYKDEFDQRQAIEAMVADRRDNVDSVISDADLAREEKLLRDMMSNNENTVAKSIIANTSAYTGGAALSGYVLESLRRALKGRVPATEEES